MVRIALLALLLLLPVRAEAMPLRTKLALGCFAVGSYLDAINTAYWSAKGVVREANPMGTIYMTPVQSHLLSAAVSAFRACAHVRCGSDTTVITSARKAS